MKVEDAIKKAIQGGFDKWTHLGTGSAERMGEVPQNNKKLEAWLLKGDSIYLDASFWQSLRKTMGWKIGEHHCPACEAKHRWLYHWHHFIDHLAEGKSAEEFFKTLN